MSVAVEFSDKEAAGIRTRSCPIKCSAGPIDDVSVLE